MISESYPQPAEAGLGRSFQRVSQKLSFIELKSESVGNLNVKSISPQHKMLTVQPSRSAKRFHHPPSVTNTNPPVHLSEARPCVKGTFNVSCSHICELCCVVLPHIIMCFYSASTQNVTLHQLTVFFLFFCWGCTMLVPPHPESLCAVHVGLIHASYKQQNKCKF